jgi:hypothetical protein
MSDDIRPVVVDRTVRRDSNGLPLPRETTCKNADGSSKRVYTSAAEAREAARRLRKSPHYKRTEHRGRVHGYRCPSCGKYHIGHEFWK